MAASATWLLQPYNVFTRLFKLDAGCFGPQAKAKSYAQYSQGKMKPSTYPGFHYQAYRDLK
jgi:hypothetical protein